MDNELLKNLYLYSAKVDRIIDGDTVVFDVDVGFGISFSMISRLARINAPEVNRKESKEAGLKAEAFLANILSLDRGKILIRTEKSTGKYGRWITEIYTQDDMGVYFNVNDIMVMSGNAVFHEY